MLANLWHWVKRCLFISGNVDVGRNLHIGLGSFVSSYGRLEIGDNVYIGKYCSIQCSGRIGCEVLIANNVGIVGRKDHDIRDIGVPIRSARHVSNCVDLANHPANHIEIDHDVWIGFGAIIMTGVKIGRGAVVAAGAVVMHDVAPYAVVSGNPALAIGVRMNSNQITKHEQIWPVTHNPSEVVG